ncbi:MAG: hypothetical protein A4E65_00039 [Syntrophorhabdus sp. PtaU1.Bin153]|nr:MAG: hypothetical protein A4E65_00039 [Syntrophorhabdus sp. PtaU1.Bin153]
MLTEFWEGIVGSIARILADKNPNQPIREIELYFFSASFVTFTFIAARQSAYGSRLAYESGLLRPFFLAVAEKVAPELLGFWGSLNSSRKRNTEELLYEFILSRLDLYAKDFDTDYSDIINHTPNAIPFYNILAHLLQELYEPQLSDDLRNNLIIALSLESVQFAQACIFIFKSFWNEQRERDEPPSFCGVDKNALIKNLVRLRIKTDPRLLIIGWDEKKVDYISEVQLAGLPESTIVTIVETWAILQKGGVSDSEIFSLIEKHRSQVFSGGEIPEMPSPLDLTSYIKYRLRIEHSDGAPIDESFIETAIEAAKKAYSV